MTFLGDESTLSYRVFSHDVTAAILVSQTSPPGVVLFSYANAFFCSVGISIRKNITYEIIMQENQISQVFRNLPVCERHYNHVLTEENMASCSRAFRKPKNAEDERKLIENSSPKSTSAVKRLPLKKYFWNGRMVGKQKSSTRALRIHPNRQVLSATLGHGYSQYYRRVTELLAE